MNIIKNLTDRINKRIAETSNPSKSYKTLDKATKVADKLSEELIAYWQVPAYEVQYIIVEGSNGRFFIGFDINRILRAAPTGGYVGALIEGHWTY